MNMKNLKVREKIFFSFGLCLIMTIILGVTSVLSVNNMNTIANNYVNISIPATNQVWTARRAVQAVQKNMLEATVVMTSKELSDVESELLEERGNLDDALAQIVVLTPQFESEVNEIQALLKEEESIRKEILTECEKLTTAANDRAYEIYTSSYEPTFQKVINGVIQLYDDINDAINTRYESAQRTHIFVVVIVLAVIFISLVIVLKLTSVLSGLITAPVREIENAMKAVSQGHLKEAVVTYESADELGMLSDSVRGTIDLLKELIADIVHLSTNLGDGNFAVRSHNLGVYIGEYGEIMTSLKYIRDTLNGTIQQIDLAAEQLLDGAEQVASGAQTLSQGATEQASSVEELAAAINDINEKVRLTTENAEAANHFTQEAEVGVTQSNDYMKALMDAMDDIQSSSNEINKIIKNIDDIAFQTNILALNAAVEAARAGEAGKGFAVVADEVRNLAGKSAEAAQTTTTLIENSMNAVEIGMKHARATAEAMKAVAEKSAVTAEKMHEISDASTEQSEAIKQLSSGIDQIASVTQTNSATSEESAAASEELSSQASFLKELTGKFTLCDSV